jgi:large subunit ribosomal protein L23
MNQEKLANVLLSPHISEKSTRVGDRANQFVFRVQQGARKPDIKRAVEAMFKVEVLNVQVCNMRGKQKGFQRRLGRRANWKKAYVRLKPGHDIDFLATE